MQDTQLSQIPNFIWGVADDLLRDLYVRGKYRDVILPMTVLRCLGRSAGAHQAEGPGREERKGGRSQQGPEPDSVDSPRGAPAAYPPYMDSKPLCRFCSVLVPLETKTSGQSATKSLPTSIIATDNGSAAVVLNQSQGEMRRVMR